MFLSQNSETTPIIRRAYEFPEGIVESGYPRNDELHDADPSRVADIRARLGIPEGNTVVMYAPTWREVGQEVELLNVVELSTSSVRRSRSCSAATCGRSTWAPASGTTTSST